MLLVYDQFLKHVARVKEQYFALRELKLFTMDEYEATSSNISQAIVKPVSGTMKLYAVLIVEGNLYSAETSCYRESCLNCEPSSLCQKWTCKTGDKNSKNLEQSGLHSVPEQLDHLGIISSENAKAGKFVSAIYENKWYVGKIEEVDQSDETVHISFMTEIKTKPSRNCFQWPRREDKLWLSLGDVLCTTTEALPAGESRRQFTVSHSYGILLRTITQSILRETTALEVFFNCILVLKNNTFSTF